MCRRCGAKEPKYFNGNICRRCIHLRSMPLEEEGIKANAELSFKFSLTPEQSRVSKELLELVNAGHSVYLEAVCGAGKTEMCLELLQHLLESNLRVAWAVPRRQVVLELSDRFKSYFPLIKVVSVCGGFTNDVLGDLIVCTTHQLFRYPQYFDVLILDEPDAFPYAGNEMLEFMAHNAVRGPIVYLSATMEHPSNIKKISLSLRPSNHLLPVPKKVNLLIIIASLYKWRKESVLVFVPSIKMARKISILLMSPMICSQTKNKETIIEKFRKEGGFLVTTTVLERGVTFSDCFVVVIQADHDVFTVSSLVQIAGRVGRGMNPKKGEVLFNGYRESVQECILDIEKHNLIASCVLKTMK